MKSRAILMLLLALVFGGLSVVLARQWLASNVAQVDEGPRVQMTTVVVARVPHYFGSRIAPEGLVEMPWPADALPQGTFKTVAEVVGDGGEPRVALAAIAANEPLLASKISGLGGRATLSMVIAEGMRAVTIRVNDVLGVAGFVLPGDRVDVLLTREEQPRSPITDILLQNIKVLGVDQEASDQKGGAVVARAVTLEVTPEQAQKLTLASTVGTLGLSLRDFGNSETEAQRTIGVGDLRLGEANSDSDPVEAKPVPRKPAPAAAAGPKVRVIRGLDASEVEVRRESASPATSSVVPTIGFRVGQAPAPSTAPPVTWLPRQVSQRP